MDSGELLSTKEETIQNRSMRDHLLWVSNISLRRGMKQKGWDNGKPGEAMDIDRQKRNKLVAPEEMERNL